jgi:hypothetical protein
METHKINELILHTSCTYGNEALVVKKKSQNSLGKVDIFKMSQTDAGYN